MKPNILIFVTDQLTWRALPYYGNTHASTPNIDRICNGGAGFDACYCTTPMCQPSRASFWSGIYPHETNILSNGRRWQVKDLDESLPTLGSVFKEAGYRAVHFGKRHDGGALRGFECAPTGRVEIPDESEAFPMNYDTYFDRYTAGQAVEFLEKNEEEPYIMVADFINPHNICGWIGEFSGPHDNPALAEPLPKLPENFDFEDIENRPLPVQYICCSHNRQAHTAQWTPDNFRHYLAAYYYFLKRVDGEIGLVLDALDKRNDRENTLIVFLSDHGDSMAARHRVTKQVDFYEEVTRVPFVFQGPGIIPDKTPIGGAPVSLLDLFPTLCSYAGIPIPKGLRGIDLCPVLTGKGTGELQKRKYVASEWHTEWGFTVSPGRMIRNDKYKYTYYLEDHSEELFDLERDPYEKENVAGKAEYSVPLSKMRALFEAFEAETKDNFNSLTCHADKKWRSHQVGYHNHRGPAAPEFEEPVPPEWAHLAKKKGK